MSLISDSSVIAVFKFVKNMNGLLLNFVNTSKLYKIVNGVDKAINNYILKNSPIVRHISTTPFPANVPNAGLASRLLDGHKTNQYIAERSEGQKVPLAENVFEVYGLNECPSLTSELTKEEALQYLRAMKRIRRMEQLAQALYLDRKIRGFCHLYIGEEACAVGLKPSMGPKDTLITSYRCHGWALLMGQTVEMILGELLGRINGSARGKGGSMHMYGTNFFGGNGIVGGHVPLGTGVALAHKYRNNGAISWTSFGDGAADQGQTFESYNMAKLWNLPIVYTIENNQYSMGTATKRHSANTRYFTRGDLIPGIKVDGMDLLAVRQAGKFAAAYVRAGKGPIILQLDTYRFRGHSMSDPGTSYRSKSEVDKIMKSKDCIKNFAEKVIAQQLISDEDLKAIQKEVKKEMKEVQDKCLKVKEPSIEETHHDVYQEYKAKVRMPPMEGLREHKNVSHLVKKNKQCVKQ